MLPSFVRDVRTVLRQMLRSPGFALLGMLSLALGIGATTAIFSAVSTVILKPLPFESPARLALLWQYNREHPAEQIEAGWGHYQEWSKQSRAFDKFALLSSVNLDFAITGEGDPIQVEGVTATATFFEILGAKPALGQWYSPEEDKPGGPAKVVISHRLWRSRYGGQPDVIGRKLTLSGYPVTIAAVAPAGFEYPQECDLWVPLGQNEQLQKMPWFRVFRTMGRLREGVTFDQAQAEMQVISARLEKEFPAQNKDLSVRLVSFEKTMFGNSRVALWTMLGAGFVVLLIACANVSNLLLARATGRSSELAVRTALGASRAQLLVHALAESFVLAILGSILGLALAYIALKGLVAIAPEDIPRVGDIALDPLAFAFAAGLTVLATVLCGLAPAIQNYKVELRDVLNEAGERGSAGRTHSVLRGSLVAAEVALSIVLLTCAGLLIRTFEKFNSLEPGFSAENILTFRVTLQGEKYAKQEERRAFYGQLIEQVNRMPGVESSAAILLRPLSGTVGWDNHFTVEGQNASDQARNPTGNYEAISPGYFRTMGIRLTDGRDFNQFDQEKGEGVVILNESTARRFFPGQSAIGKRVKLGKPESPAPWLKVVGVVNDVRYREWEATRADAYIPYTQRAQHRSDFVVRARGNPLDLVPAIRQAVLKLNPNQPISKVTTMERLVDAALARPRFNMMLLTLFALCALALAAFGVFSVLSYTVVQRTREIGIRMALGGTPRDIISFVLRSGMRFVFIGLVAGLAVSLFAARAMESLLFDTKTFDPLAFLGGTLLLVVVATLACSLPALRATRIEPRNALQAN
jgi:putative ABC transport system permease protein